MENVIANLLEQFERGKMSRRQLIQSIAVVATAAAGAAPAVAQTSKGFKTIGVNHISYQCADYAKTRDFYADLMGMKVVGDTGTQCFMVLGDSNSFLIPRNSRQADATPKIDHIAYTIETWDKDGVKAELDRRGLNPKLDTDNSYHVRDVNGYDLQICGTDMKPPV